MIVSQDLPSPWTKISYSYRGMQDPLKISVANLWPLTSKLFIVKHPIYGVDNTWNYAGHSEGLSSSDLRPNLKLMADR